MNENNNDKKKHIFPDQHAEFIYGYTLRESNPTVFSFFSTSNWGSTLKKEEFAPKGAIFFFKSRPYSGRAIASREATGSHKSCFPL